MSKRTIRVKKTSNPCFLNYIFWKILCFYEKGRPASIGKVALNINRIVLSLLLLFISSFSLLGQSDEKIATEILDKAMGPIGNEEGSWAIYFEGVAFEIDKPKEIFSLPVYKVHRGGYMITEGRKFEMELGLMKALSDGNQVVIIDEQTKMMLIDSVGREANYNESEVEKLLNEFIGEGTFKYEGKEIVNGKFCHKIKAFFPEDPSTHILYWVEENTNKLLLMGEYNGGSYTSYWISKITKAPKGHVYKVNIPKHELKELYGYEVQDMRFISQDN